MGGALDYCLEILSINLMNILILYEDSHVTKSDYKMFLVPHSAIT